MAGLQRKKTDGCDQTDNKSTKLTTDDTAVLIVGDPKLRVGDIVKALGHNEMALVQLTNNWIDLARALKVPEPTVMEYETDLLLKRKNHLRIVESSLFDWCGREARNATLNSLIKIAESLQMNAVADVLQTFNVPVEGSNLQ